MKIIKDQSLRNLTEAVSLLKEDTVSIEDKQAAQKLIRSTILLLGKL